MSSFRHLIVHNYGGAPVMSQARRALWSISIFSLEMYKAGSSCGWGLPSIRCNVVNIAMVPQDQG